MRRSKNQAIYKFLPGMWISEKDEELEWKTIMAIITKWNYAKMEGIYSDFIENEIKHQIKL